MTAYSIIALFLGASIFRFIRQTHTAGNVMSMVPNLLVIVGLSFVAMETTDDLAYVIRKLDYAVVATFMFVFFIFEMAVVALHESKHCRLSVST